LETVRDRKYDSLNKVVQATIALGVAFAARRLSVCQKEVIR